MQEVQKCENETVKMRVQHTITSERNTKIL